MVALPEKISELSVAATKANSRVPFYDPDTGSTFAALGDDLGAPAAAVAQAAAISYANIPSGTGILTASLLSINADPTKFDLQAGQGYIIDNWTTPSAPTAVLVTWGAFSAQTATYRTTDTATTVMIDSTGAIVQKNTPPTHADYRDYIVIGKLIHTTKANILGVSPFVRAIPSSDLMAYDLANFLGVLARGVDITANGANLNLNRSAGTLFRVGSNAASGLKDPNESDLGSSSAISFSYRYRDGSGGFKVDASTTSISPSLYDDGDGTLADPGAGKFTIQRVYVFTNGNTFVVPGQTVYNNLDDAKAAIVTERPVLDPQLADANLRAFIVVKRGATNLQTAADAYFLPGGLLGQPGGGGGGGSSAAGGFGEYRFQDYKGPAIIGILGVFDAVEARTLAEVTLQCDTLPVGSNLIAELRKNNPASGNNVLSATLQVTTTEAATNLRYVGTSVTSFLSTAIADGDVFYLVLTSVGSTTPATNPRAVMRYA
jgi:hypothetical protein